MSPRFRACTAPDRPPWRSSCASRAASGPAGASPAPGGPAEGEDRVAEMACSTRHRSGRGRRRAGWPSARSAHAWRRSRRGRSRLSRARSGGRRARSRTRTPRRGASPERVDLALADAVIGALGPGFFGLGVAFAGSASRNWPPGPGRGRPRGRRRARRARDGGRRSPRRHLRCRRRRAVRSCRRSRSGGQALAGEPSAGDAQQGGGDVHGDGAIAELGQQLAHPAAAATEVDDPCPAGAELLGQDQDLPQQPGVLLATAGREGFGGVVLNLVGGGVAAHPPPRGRGRAARARDQTGRPPTARPPRPRAAPPAPALRPASPRWAVCCTRRSTQARPDSSSPMLERRGLGPGQAGFDERPLRRTDRGQGGGGGEANRPEGIGEKRRRAPARTPSRHSPTARAAAVRTIQERSHRALTIVWRTRSPRAPELGSSRRKMPTRWTRALRAYRQKPRRHAVGSSRTRAPSADTARLRVRQSPRTARRSRRPAARGPWRCKTQEALEGKRDLGDGARGQRSGASPADAGRRRGASRP